jgi:hypothetical protein
MGNEDEFNSNLDKLHIGDLIRTNFIKLKRRNSATKDFYKNSISCIGGKKNIAMKLIDIMDSEEFKFDDLPKKAKELVKRIYEFINTNNSH